MFISSLNKSIPFLNLHNIFIFLNIQTHQAKTYITKIHTFGEYFKICSLWCNNSSFLNTRSRGCDLRGVTSCSFNFDLEWTLTNFFASKIDDNLENSNEKCESRGLYLDHDTMWWIYFKTWQFHFTFIGTVKPA